MEEKLGKKSSKCFMEKKMILLPYWPYCGMLRYKVSFKIIFHIIQSQMLEISLS